ncbi:MAG: hypothetical protein ACOZQL_18415 [Myxococcota bacterium]
MRITSDTPGLVVAEREGLLALVLRQSPDDRAFAAFSEAIADALTRQSRLSTVLLIPRFDGRTRASREAQRAFVDFMGSVADRHLGMAIVVGVEGVKGMMLRLTVNAVLMLAQLKRPVHLVASVADAVDWLKGLPEQSRALEAPELAHELAALMNTP